MTKIHTNKCGIGAHPLGKYGKPVLVKEIYLKAIRQIRKGFDLNDEVCENCYRTLKRTMLEKHLRRKQKTNSIAHSSESSSDRQTSLNASNLNRNQQSPQTTSQNLNSPPRNASQKVLLPSISSSSSELSFEGPTTSAAAAAAKLLRDQKNKKLQAVRFVEVTVPTGQKRITDYTHTDDDFSLNATNGTRLPDVQPIPKRRKFVTANKDVMDIYLAGTTGG